MKLFMENGMRQAKFSDAKNRCFVNPPCLGSADPIKSQQWKPANPHLKIYIYFHRPCI